MAAKVHTTLYFSIIRVFFCGGGGGGGGGWVVHFQLMFIHCLTFHYRSIFFSYLIY